MLKQRANPTQLPQPGTRPGPRLGVRRTTPTGSISARSRGLTLVEENHLIQNLLKLRSGSVDVVIGDRRTVIWQLNEYMSDRITDFAVVDIPCRRCSGMWPPAVNLPGYDKLIAEFNRATGGNPQGRLPRRQSSSSGMSAANLTRPARGCRWYSLAGITADGYTELGDGNCMPLGRSIANG